MKPYIGMHHLILLAALVALGDCWPMFEVEHKLKLKIARDSHPAGSSSINSSVISTETLSLSKKINTALTSLIILLAVGTYWLLMKYTATLSNEIILPSKFIEDNIAKVLSLTWPKYHIGPSNETFDQEATPWKLFYRGVTNTHESKLMEQSFYEALGSQELKGTLSTLQSRSSVTFIKAFSRVMKNLVQIAIWNSISFWLVLVMIINTLAYNGFMSKNITNDSIIRLVLVVVYAVANLGHQYRTTILLYRNFTFVLFQTCWTIICKQFLFVAFYSYFCYILERKDSGIRYRDPSRRFPSETKWTSLNFELFGTTERSNIYRFVKASDHVGSYEGTEFKMWSADDERREFHLMAQDKTESGFDKFVKPIREAEIKAYEKETDSALEKALANVAVLLGICLATALAPWTSTQTINATGTQVGSYANATFTQLGSYALLLSISTGVLALVSGIAQLSSATDSARTLLLLQEKTIEDAIDPYDGTDLSNLFSLRDEPDFTFSKGIAGTSPLTSYGLWRLMSLIGKLLWLLFGSALILIPRFHQGLQRFEIDDKKISRIHRNLRMFEIDKNELFFTVEGATFTCQVAGPRFGEIDRAVCAST